MRNNITWVAAVALVGAMGCAASFQQVPDTQWNTVPTAQRTTLDHQCDADAVAANKELANARAAAIAPAPKAVHLQSKSAVTVDGAWGAAVATHEKQKAAVAAEVDREQVAVRAADTAWKRARLATATLRLEVVRAEREYARAKAVDHNLLGSDTYEDLGMFQGQLARAQDRWYKVAADLKSTHEALVRATAKVTTDKERYATLVRTGPAAPEDAQQRMVLAHWFVPRASLHKEANLRPVLAQVGPVGASADAKYRLQTRFKK